MRTKVYWINGPWPGKLAIAARPRGGDWLEDEVRAWGREGVDTVLSLLTSEEETDLGLQEEARRVKDHSMKFISLPIPDRQVPGSQAELSAVLDKLDADLASGKNILVHCRQGVGRTGLVAACLLVNKGLSADAAIKDVGAARGLEVPETAEQRRWIDHYALVMASTR